MEFERVAEGLAFPEGPVVTKRGTVLIAEVASGLLVEVDPTDGSKRTVADCGGGPNGVAIGPDGAVYVCNNGGMLWDRVDDRWVPGVESPDYVGGSIQKVDIATGRVETLYTHCGEHRLKAPNDLVFDEFGGFWFTDCGHTHERTMDLGGLYYAKADGSEIREVVFPLHQANGVGLSPDGSVVYVAETSAGRAWAWQVDAPGHVAPGTGPGAAGGRLLWGFEGNQKLDSLAVDSAGNVCVATLEAGMISVISPDGSLLEQHLVPGEDRFVTNICFADGPDGFEAFVTSGGTGHLYRAEWPRSGSPLPYALD